MEEEKIQNSGEEQKKKRKRNNYYRRNKRRNYGASKNEDGTSEMNVLVDETTVEDAESIIESEDVLETEEVISQKEPSADNTVNEEPAQRSDNHRTSHTKKRNKRKVFLEEKQNASEGDENADTAVDENVHSDVEDIPENNAEGIAEEKADALSEGDELSNDEESNKQEEIIGIRFRDTGKVYYFSPGQFKVVAGDSVIVETVRGMELGNVVIPNKMVSVSEIVSPLKSVVRMATEEDKNRVEENKKLEAKAREFFCEKVKEHDLSMTLVDVEYTFDNTKLLFYFTSEGRVDFRELVKELASVYKTRIELRQIGVRDEAKQIGGLGICGRPFCCKTFLNDFQQVTIKMAKDQNLSLNSTKISGTCGRLMCCLRYENDVYEEEAKKTPRVDSIVETPMGRGVVTEANVLLGMIKVALDKTPESAPEAFHRSKVKIISSKKREEDIPEDLKALEDKN